MNHKYPSVRKREAIRALKRLQKTGDLKPRDYHRAIDTRSDSELLEVLTSAPTKKAREKAAREIARRMLK